MNKHYQSQNELESDTRNVYEYCVYNCKDGIIEINRGKSIPESNNSIEVKITR